MRFGGKVVGILIILLTVLLAAASIYYTQQLEAQRTVALHEVATLPAPERCAYDDAKLCPQAEAVSVPDVGAIGFVALGLLLGIYLIMNDMTQNRILAELGTKRQQVSGQERFELIMSVLTPDEQKIIAAVKEQPGISQATLRLRTDMSKAKLSMLLKELERRGLIRKIEDGKTNAVHLKREL